jgi:hypothetical protein
MNVFHPVQNVGRKCVMCFPADFSKRKSETIPLPSSTGCRIASLAVVAEPRLRRWHRDRNYFDANDAILILSRYFGSLNVLFVCVCEVRPRKDQRGLEIIFDALPFGRLWHGEPDAVSNAIGYTPVFPPLARCCDSRLQCSRRRGRNARTSERV